ncbi:MAG: Zn-dependent rane-bound protease, family protein [Candidatus Saccharibacteria bacterium]|nr:Zn-dependent rane-bound protease, family protein [Candidatus Saccharibacteria bacterium]
MDILYIVIVIAVILFSMTLHEAMHAFTGYWLGDDTAKLQGRLTLNPIKHIDPFLTLLLPIMLALIGAPIFGGAKPVPFNPDRVRFGEWGAALIAVAGPLTNLLIAFVVFGVATLIGDPIDLFSSPDSILGLVLYVMVVVNLGFFAFNILPIPPLDGSRVVYALAPEFVRRGMEAIERFGIIFVFLIVFMASSQIGALMSAMIQFFLGIFTAVFGLF